ncbi:MAG: hypothetical protein K2X00_11265 [Nitrospiraceae bacterium]|nr:hypothetical protein [Nitrospiraceae bacterium]
MAERFHIAEWYGHPFLELSDEDRRLFADHKVGGSTLTKAEQERLVSLDKKEATGNLSKREKERLSILRQRLDSQRKNEKPCPFRTDITYPTCTKPGGVCSLQLFSDASGQIESVSGERGMIRATCPYRFHQDNIVFKMIGERILDEPHPKQIGEVGFLESTGSLDSPPGTDVGYIDMILINHPAQHGPSLKWTAVEIQAVYFSGKEMPIEFKQIKESHGRASMPKEARRPDYRSSGPKRLMPQLQIKVPTLRRWGKKMAVVVDVPFFRSMGAMRTVSDVSNADIVWFLVDFVRVDGKEHRQIVVVEEHCTTLEAAIEGLTGGVPVSLGEFEKRIGQKSG